MAKIKDNKLYLKGYNNHYQLEALKNKSKLFNVLHENNKSKTRKSKDNLLKKKYY